MLTKALLLESFLMFRFFRHSVARCGILDFCVFCPAVSFNCKVRIYIQSSPHAANLFHFVFYIFFVCANCATFLIQQKFISIFCVHAIPLYTYFILISVSLKFSRWKKNFRKMISSFLGYHSF